jgi:hypothetical protein
VPWEISAHTHTAREIDNNNNNKKKNNNQKTHQEQWEVVERGCQAKPKKELEEKERKYQNGRLDIIETDFFFLSLSWFFFPFVLSVETRR